MRLRVLELPVDLTFGAEVSTSDRRRIEQAWARCVDATSTAPAVTADDSGAAALHVVLRVGEAGQDAGEGLRGEAGEEAGSGVRTDGAEADASAADTRTVRGPTLAYAEQSLTSRLTLWGIDDARRRLLMLHALGLSDEQGRVAILAAPSGTGKTTFARTGGADLGYVTDETVAITPEGRIVPYPKPLSVIEQPGRPKVQIGPDAVGLRRPPQTALRPTLLVMLDRQEEPTEPRLEPMEPADALVALMPQISYVADTPGRLAAVVRAIERCGGMRRLVYAEAAEALPVVRRALAESAPVAVDWAPALPDAGADAPAQDATDAASRGQRAPAPAPAGPESSVASADETASVVRIGQNVLDAIWIGDEALALVDRRVYRLQGLGAAIWQELALAGGEIGWDALVAELQGQGQSPVGEADRVTLLDAALAALRESGLVR